MKKRILILAVLVLLPVMVFADLGVGGAAFFKSPVLLGQSVDTDYLNVNQFSFGGAARYELLLFQADALILLSTGDINSLDMFLDAGIGLNIAILRLSLGAGPNFTYNFGKSSPAQVGLNAKIGADVKLGSLSAGLAYIMALNMDNGFDLNASSGLLGANVLFWM